VRIGTGKQISPAEIGGQCSIRFVEIERHRPRRCTAAAPDAGPALVVRCLGASLALTWIA